MKDDNPFFFVKSINSSPVDQMTEDNEKYYNPFLVNKCLGYHTDSILYANLMNQCHQLSNEMQYDFYRMAIPKRQRYSGKFPKGELNDDVKIIAQHFDLCYRKALEIYYLLGEDDRKEIINKYKDI